MVKKLYIFIVLWVAITPLFGQKLLSYVTVNTNSAYIGQPIELKVSVFTTTWFTKGIDVGNIQIDGGLTVYFRSVSTSQMINNKRYSGVEFYYNLFPTQEGVLEIPSLNIYVESPQDGDYKGVGRTIRTKAKKIIVNSIPLGYSHVNWLVASSLAVREKWSAPLENIKVGDVVQRTISRSVGSTLSEFIPSSFWDSIPGISIYPKRPLVNTEKSKTGVSASRSETVNYLFEKEGEVIIPKMEYMYWNLRTKRIYLKKVDSVVINVKPNDDLVMLQTIKKSLQKEKIIIEEEESSFLILGLSPMKFAVYLILGLVAFYFLIKIFKKIAKVASTYYTRYNNSEQFAFRRLKSAIKRSDFPNILKESNLWLKKLSNRKLTLHKLSKETESIALKNVLDEINETIYNRHVKVKQQTYSLLLAEIKRARSAYKKENRENMIINNQASGWLNPVVTK